jgi:hypothetical protein
VDRASPGKISSCITELPAEGAQQAHGNHFVVERGTEWRCQSVDGHLMHS